MSDEKQLPALDQQITDIAQNEGQEFVKAITNASAFMFDPAIKKAKKELIDLVNEKLRILSQEKDGKVEDAKTLVITKSSKNIESLRQELVKKIDDTVKNLEARLNSKIASERVATVGEVRSLIDGMEISINSATLSGTLSLPKAEEKPKK